MVCIKVGKEFIYSEESGYKAFRDKINKEIEANKKVTVKETRIEALKEIREGK